jgi:hypothetical protein
MSLVRCLPTEPPDRVNSIQANIELMNPKEIKLHWLIANHAWACVYDIDMVYSKHTCIEEWVGRCFFACSFSLRTKKHNITMRSLWIDNIFTASYVICGIVKLGQFVSMHAVVFDHDSIWLTLKMRRIRDLKL